MEKKQTALYWLVNTINDKIDYIPIKYWDNIRIIIEQAKAMEKAQIIHSYVSKGYLLDGNSFENLYKEAEEYYNKTYKTEYDGKETNRY
jgi:hypothetical protein